MEKLKQNGYVVVPGVLTPAEVSRLRGEVGDILDNRGISKAGGSVLPNAAVESPQLAWAFAHEQVVDAVRRATGLRDLVFTLEADLHRNYQAGAWHKDTGEHLMPGGYFGLDWLGRDDCQVYKVAIYLQDHSRGGALTVRPGTVKTRAVDEGAIEELQTAPGDIVVFDVRLSHRGVVATLGSKVLLGLAGLSGKRGAAVRWAKLRRRMNRLVGRADRIAVYFAFGLPNENTAAFARRNLGRQLQQLGKDPVPLASVVEDAFALVDVRTLEIGQLPA
jgi:hypothetical protein